MYSARAYTPADVAAATAVHNHINPTDQLTRAHWRRRLLDLRPDGRAWIVESQAGLIGYALAAPVPGLPGLTELSGGIAPAFQRQGAGSYLLRYLIADLQAAPVKQLSYPVATLTSPAARFLLHHDFFDEHEEWQMGCDLARWRPAAGWQEKGRQQDLRLAHYSLATTVSRFCSLYQASFAGTPWNQPFTEEEVGDLLREASDIQFLESAGQTIGFIWIQPGSPRSAQLEPVGISRAWQGRGYGRWLLTAVLQRLQQQGYNQAELGVWSSNHRALRLYEAFGFKHKNTLTYLALDL